jgi:hypothetical protein
MAAAPHRPGVVTFIGVILYIYAAMAAVAALALLIFSNNDTIQQNSGQSLGLLVGSGIGEAVIAALLFVVAAALMRGNPSARLFVTVVVGLRMTAAVAVTLLHHEGGYLFSALISAAIGLFVIWALYGHEASNEYFNRLEGGGRAAAPPPSAP